MNQVVCTTIKDGFGLSMTVEQEIQTKLAQTAGGRMVSLRDDASETRYDFKDA